MCLGSEWAAQWEGFLNPSPGQRQQFWGGSMFFQPSPKSSCWCSAFLSHLCHFLLLGRVAKWVRIGKALQGCWSHQSQLLPKLVMIWKLSFQKDLPPQHLGQSCTVLSHCCSLDRCVPAARSAQAAQEWSDHWSMLHCHLDLGKKWQIFLPHNSHTFHEILMNEIFIGCWAN